MTNAINTFNDILNVDLRPWIVNYSPQKYLQEIATIKKEAYQFQPLYDVDFTKPLNEKRKYYHTVIENAAITFLNELHSQIETASNEQEKSYWVFMALKRQLPSKFNAVDKLIDRKNYQFAKLNRTNDDAYIIQYLKYQLVRLYLEVQDYYAGEIEDEPLTEEDLLAKFSSEPPFSKSLIIEAEELNLPKQRPALSIQPDEPRFTPVKKDVREPQDGVLRYSEIITNPDRFARFEEDLFSNEYIDRNYQFLMAYGKKKEMGAILHVLIRKGYFLERNFKAKKKISRKDICKFLEHRYNTELDKCFRDWNNKPEELADLTDTFYWLSNLPLS